MREKLEQVPLKSIEEFSDFDYEEKNENSMEDQVCTYFEKKFLDVIEEIKSEDAKNSDERHVKLIFNPEKQLTFYNSEALSFVYICVLNLYFSLFVCLCVCLFCLFVCLFG